MSLALAIDIGGTKLAAGLVNASGVLLVRRSVPTPDVGAARLFSAVASLVDEVRSSAAGDVVVCGVGCGGPMTPGGETVSPLNIPGWRGFPLRDRLVGQLSMPVFIDNDAKALALAEGWCGAAVGCRDFLAMVVSTGVGGGVVSDGRLLDGASGNAGHIGHVIAVPGGRRCGCGGAGCLEAEVSGRALEAMTGRPAAEASLAWRERSGRLVGEVVGSVVHLLDLRLVVVAGSVALGFGQPFFDAAQAALGSTAQLPYAHGARIVPGGLGDAGPLIGAAAVGWRGMGVDVGERARAGAEPESRRDA